MSSNEDTPKGEGARIGVGLVDGHELFRRGVTKVLRGTRFTVLAEGGSVKDAILMASRHRLEILLIDLCLPDGGMQAVASLAKSWPSVKLVVLTASEQKDDVANALQCGARGYVLKSASEADLRGALNAVANGEVYLTPALGARLFSRPTPVRPAATSTLLSQLTPRETEILSRVSSGSTNKEIARSLNIREKTVKAYMTSIMQKLQVRNRVEAVNKLRDTELST